MNITIDAEFQALCPPLLPEEREQLEASLLAEGCREPLCVWREQWSSLDCKYCGGHHPVTFEQGRWECDNCQYGLEPAHYLLLDGHNRYTLCEQHHIAFTTQTIWLESREEAINWIIANQLGRRNLTPEQKSYLRGKRYNLEKRQDGGHGDQKSGTQNDYSIHKKLAEEYQVAPATIQRDGAFATAVDTLEAQVRQDIRDTVLRRQNRDQGKITKQKTIKAGKLVQEQHVVPQPFMRRAGWKPYQVLQAIELLDDLPAAEHQAVNTLLDRPFLPGEEGVKILTHLLKMGPTQRQEIYQLQASTDPRHQSEALTRAAQKPPEPDPQIHLARHCLEALTALRKYHDDRWRAKFPNEPWAGTLAEIETRLAAVHAVWQTILTQLVTHQSTRRTDHGLPVTAD